MGLNKNVLSVEKVLKKKSVKIFAKWKGYDSCFNSWINKTGFLKRFSCGKS